MVTGKCTDVFRGIFLVWDEELMWWGLRTTIFPRKNFSWGKRLSIKGAQDFLALLKKKTMKKSI